MKKYFFVNKDMSFEEVEKDCLLENKENGYQYLFLEYKNLNNKKIVYICANFNTKEKLIKSLNLITKI